MTTTSATPVPPVSDVQLRIRGLRIHAQICGEGEPLLLYSGIWGEVGLWERLLPHLSGFRTIAFDPPGIGRSQMPTFPLTMPALARFGTAVLDELGIDSAHMLGASFGGALAQQTAISHPERLRRLVLVSTSFGGFAKPGSLTAFWHFIHPRSYHPQRLERVAGSMFGGRLRQEPELVRSMHIRRPTNTLAVMYRLAPLFGWTSLPWLWTIRHPTLVIAGDDDPITPLFNHRVIAAMVPGARLHVVRGGGHLALLDSAPEIGPVVASFLRGQPAAPVNGHRLASLDRGATAPDASGGGPAAS
jgi:poly(3-hydroxyoctanoate) depolymerase